MTAPVEHITPDGDDGCTVEARGAFVVLTTPGGAPHPLTLDQATALAARLLSAHNAVDRKHRGGAS